MKKIRVGGFVAVVAAAVSVQAATWQVSMDKPDAQGLTGVASLSNALEKVASGDTIVIGPGTYDLSEMPPVDCGSYALLPVHASCAGLFADALVKGRICCRCDLK